MMKRENKLLQKSRLPLYILWFRIKSWSCSRYDAKACNQCWAHLRRLVSGQHSYHSGGEPLATLCPIWPAREPYLRPKTCRTDVSDNQAHRPFQNKSLYMQKIWWIVDPWQFSFSYFFQLCHWKIVKIYWVLNQLNLTCFRKMLYPVKVKEEYYTF